MQEWFECKLGTFCTARSTFTRSLGIFPGPWKLESVDMSSRSRSFNVVACSVFHESLHLLSLLLTVINTGRPVFLLFLVVFDAFLDKAGFPSRCAKSLRGCKPNVRNRKNARKNRIQNSTRNFPKKFHTRIMDINFEPPVDASQLCIRFVWTGPGSWHAVPERFHKLPLQKKLQIKSTISLTHSWDPNSHYLRHPKAKSMLVQISSAIRNPHRKPTSELSQNQSEMQMSCKTGVSSSRLTWFRGGGRQSLHMMKQGVRHIHPFATNPFFRHRSTCACS